MEREEGRQGGVREEGRRSEEGRQRGREEEEESKCPGVIERRGAHWNSLPPPEVYWWIFSS